MKQLPTSRYILFACVALTGLTADLLTKWWAFKTLGYPGRQSDWTWSCPFLWGRFSIQFTTSFNQGALFGIGQGMTWLFALFSVVAVAFVIYWLFFRGEARSRWLTFTLALIMTGALGNLYDRLYLHGCADDLGKPLYGVRDFIDCTIPWIGWDGGLRFKLVREYKWPIFNLADTFLVTGAIMLTLYSLFAPAAAFNSAAVEESAVGKRLSEPLDTEKRAPAASVRT